MDQRKIIEAPQPINSSHDISQFKSKSETLNNWLKEKAFKNEGDTARTYVVICENKVIGYYCLASAGVYHSVAIRKVKQNAPDPVPCMIVGRLAADEQWEGQGIGSGLLRDAIFRVLQASKIVGIRCILVHAKDEAAKQFYLKHKFKPSPIEPLTLMLPLKDIVTNL
ncbi:GNAT family N-acetyltransferase [Sphaerospermopsis sp. LEGE 00249]|uniref:GNAT family N-acetyltransferase n=1 Tax=Sphaerospermopsis sp. LEGE 00249 TaxID=1380707 RepID=UPI00164E4EA5|nr:GNAT family N-acetyltransferase [Sphaerospermopsis sp. LEGE 00249]MBC5794739.1 GNAT family N-acetyltransferase [Sphaerospermopsis sp. LEGE 00249]